MENMSELDSLIVLNIGDLDAVATRINALGYRLWKDIAEQAESWAEGPGWFGHFETDEVWLAPDEWRQPEDEPIGWFYFGFGAGDTESLAAGEPYFELSRYLGEAGGELCLWLHQNAAKSKIWKTSARAMASELAAAGFSMTDACNFYTRCSLNREEVSQALKDEDLTGALHPVLKALDLALASIPNFQKLLDKAQNS
ncbi:hypothetical protein C8J35_1062 [Rhizobium sp. PP-F2F-G38]|nr:hypothetical protein C8J35_1062 [Rhizobium sp. PP-F2F-G38]